MPEFFFLVELYRACEQIKARHHLRDQLLRASLSVVLNLSEGSAKPQDRERKRFYQIAFASLRETQTLLDLLNQKELYKLADKTGASVYRLLNPKPSASPGP